MPRKRHTRLAPLLSAALPEARSAVLYFVTRDGGLAGLSIERHYLQAQGSWNIFGD